MFNFLVIGFLSWEAIQQGMDIQKHVQLFAFSVYWYCWPSEEIISRLCLENILSVQWLTWNSSYKATHWCHAYSLSWDMTQHILHPWGVSPLFVSSISHLCLTEAQKSILFNNLTKCRLCRWKVKAESEVHFCWSYLLR